MQSRYTARPRGFLLPRALATTPGINRRPNAGGGIDCAEGDSGPPRYAVRPAGRAPARLAVHCCLATGGPGAATPHAPFGRPRRPLGTFPRGESTSSARRRTKPLTRNRFLMEGKGKSLYFRFLFLRRFRLCGGDQRAFRSPFGNLRPLATSRNLCKKQLPCRGQENAFLSRITNTFASAEAPRGLPPSPPEPLSLAKNIPSTAWRIRNIKNPRPSRPKAAEARGSILPKDSSFSR